MSEATGRDQTLLDQEMVLAKLNRTMIGWANYFCLGPVRTAPRGANSHASKKLRRWLCAKHKVLGGGVIEGIIEASGGIPAQTAGSPLPDQADEQFPVGHFMYLSPGAGCLEQACRVR